MVQNSQFYDSTVSKIKAPICQAMSVLALYDLTFIEMPVTSRLGAGA